MRPAFSFPSPVTDKSLIDFRPHRLGSSGSELANLCALAPFAHRPKSVRSASNRSPLCASVDLLRR